MDDPIFRERDADYLLLAAYQSGSVAIFDEAGRFGSDEAERLARAKLAADLLVAAKMARFTGDDRTEIAVTNAGRYWALHGGFLAFLKEEPPGGGGGRQRNPELEAMRLNFMKLRLSTFWWSFGFSLAGFLISLVSLAIALIYGHDLIGGRP